jgi:hypothetical protein
LSNKVDSIVIPKRTPASLAICTSDIGSADFSTHIDRTINKDSFSLNVWICNDGDYEAINLIDTLCIVKEINNRFKTLVFNTHSASPTATIHSKKALQDRMFIKKFVSNFSNAYLCYRMHYTDSTNKDGLMEKILKIDRLESSEKLADVPGDEYIRVKDYLLQSKIWQ